MTSITQLRQGLTGAIRVGASSARPYLPPPAVALHDSLQVFAHIRRQSPGFDEQIVETDPKNRRSPFHIFVPWRILLLTLDPGPIGGRHADPLREVVHADPLRDTPRPNAC